MKTKYLLFALSIMIVLSSCGKIMDGLNQNTTKTEAVNAIENESNDNAGTAKKSKVVDEKFLNSIHYVSNDATETEQVVRGDGTIIMRTTSRDNENLSIIEDIYDNEPNFIQKTYYGEKIVISTYSIAETGVDYTTKDLSSRTIVYDTNGKEIGLEIDNQNVRFSAKNKLFYNEYTDNVGSFDLRIYDTDTKKSEKMKHKYLSHFSDFIVNSSSSWDKTDAPYETLIYDINMNPVKQIKGYTMTSDLKIAGQKYMVMKKVSTQSYIDYNEKDWYNYMDDHFNFLFDEDVRTVVYNSDNSIATVNRDDIEFDYDFVNRKQVGETRAYAGYENNFERLRIIKDKYEATASYIKTINSPAYDYVDTRYYEGKVLFFGHNYIDKEPSLDVYDERANLLLKAEDLTSVFEDEGLFLLDYQTLYDFDLNVVKKFDTKIILDRYSKFGKVFFADSNDDNYQDRETFNLYDIDFNILIPEVTKINTYLSDDYIILSKKKNTYILDKNLNPTKTIVDRRLNINHWYNDVKYYNFKDLDTNRAGVMDPDFNILVDGLKSATYLQEKYFTYLNGFKYGLMDYEGNVLLSYSIFDTMSEDSVRDDYKIKYVE